MHRVANIVLEVVEETDRDIRQVTEDVLAGGIEAEGDGMEFGIVVVVRLPGRQAEASADIERLGVAPEAGQR